jgi:hypothetical protein
MEREAKQLFDTWRNLAKKYEQVPLRANCALLPVNGVFFRQIHDRLGWMAKLGNGRHVRGRCDGTLLRSERFIAIPADQRRSDRHGANIHVEHTIPIISLTNLWNDLIATGVLQSVRKAVHGAQPSDVLAAFIFRYSVITAIHYLERSCILPGYHKHSDFYPNRAGVHHREGGRCSLSTGNSQPFHRYNHLTISPIINLVTQAEVDQKTFSIDDWRQSMFDLLLQTGWNNQRVTLWRRVGDRLP